MASRAPSSRARGVLELHPNGYGFLRCPDNNYTREMTDPFVPGSMIEKYGLREGVLINGMVQAGRRQQGPRLREILDVDGMPPDAYKNVKTFRSVDGHQSRVLAQAGNRTRAADHAGDGPPDAVGQGAAGFDRRPAAHRQDHPLAAYQQRHLHQLPRRQADRPADRRAARGSDRHEAGGQRRSGRQQSRPRYRKPRAVLSARRRTLQASGRDGQGRRHAHGLDHQARTCVQQVGRQHRPHNEAAASISKRWISRKNCSPPLACSRKAAR